MGAWGPAIFSDDTALDVRGAFRELLEDGHDPEEATQLLLERLAGYFDDSDDGPVSWLALAATQWRYGCLTDDIKDRAINIIDTGAGLDRWEEAGQKALESRKKALTKLRDQLSSPQKPFKRPKKPWRYETDLEIGDAISFRLDSGQFVIFRVLDVVSSRYARAPVIELCDWIGDKIPSRRAIERLPFAIDKNCSVETSYEHINAHKKSAYPADRIDVVARGLKVRRIDMVRVYAGWALTNDRLNYIAPYLSKRPPFLSFFSSKPYRKLKRP